MARRDLGDGRVVMNARRAVALSGVMATSIAGLAKVIALISPEDGYAEDGGGEDFWSVYAGTR